MGDSNSQTDQGRSAATEPFSVSTASRSFDAFSVDTPPADPRPTVWISDEVYAAIQTGGPVELHGWLHARSASIGAGDAIDGSTCVGVASLDGEEPGSGRVWIDLREKRAFLRDGAAWRPAQLRTYGANQILERVKPLLGASGLADRTVVIVGLGSAGSEVAMHLARQGVGGFALIDHDRLEPGNLCRHVLGAADIGDAKVEAMARAIHRVNPTARVRTFQHDVRDRRLAFERLVAAADLVICLADTHAARRYVNGVCVAMSRPFLTGGFYESAVASETVFYAPGATSCFTCIHPTEGTDAVAGAELPYMNAGSEVSMPGLSIDLAHGVSIIASHALALLEPHGLRISALNPEVNMILAHAGTQPAGELASIFSAPWQVVGCRTQRDERCPHCSDTAEAVEYRERTRAFSVGGLSDPMSRRQAMDMGDGHVSEIEELS